MTLAKASALVLGFVGAMALGVLIAPHLPERWTADRDTVTTAPTASTDEAAGPARSTSRSASRATPAKSGPAAAPARKDASEIAKASVSPSTPELQQRLKPVLNRGADMTKASEGFRSGTEFAAVAHAARNTGIPFMVLKHRVVNEGKSLEAAIRAANPELDAGIAANLARAQARSDIASLGT